MRGANRVQYLSKYKNYLELNRYTSGIIKQLQELNKRKCYIEAGGLSDNKKKQRLQQIKDLKIEHTMRLARKRHQLGLKYL